jgi:hypothetical protein
MRENVATLRGWGISGIRQWLASVVSDRFCAGNE